MAQAEVGGVPQQGVLLRRAHELLESIGQPVSEELLLQHLFGVNEGTAKNALWLALLRNALRSSSMFEETGEHQWALVAWRSTHQTLDEIEFVILDTETTGLRPGHHRVIELAGIRMRAGEVVGSFQSLLNPGIRWAYNFKNGLQIVPGIALPFGVGPSKGEKGIFLYLSLEHPYRKLPKE